MITLFHIFLPFTFFSNVNGYKITIITIIALRLAILVNSAVYIISNFKLCIK